VSVLRPGLLAQVSVVLAAGAPPALADALRRLGARTGDAVDPDGPVAALVLDSRESFAAAGRGGLEALLEALWSAIAPHLEALIARPGPARVVLVAPPEDAGPLATAARAAVENLARTLSVEWARHEITVVAVLAGSRTPEDELAELLAFLLSPAAGYYSGCALTLR
jgi:NAD(P)-dependent dehydrogenase (short-subunit alcohol dehydrogenase family)